MKIKKKLKVKPKFVKVEVKDNGSSLMECGSTSYCNESKK
jgi:hypothetical protein